MDIQQRIGADIVMQLDQCIGYPAEKEAVAASTKLSWEWAERCCAAHTREDQALFAIVHGGMHRDLRIQSARRLMEIDAASRAAGHKGFQGFGIGGYSVGEPHDVMFETLGAVCDALPQDKPRYLMGVGIPPRWCAPCVKAWTCSTACFLRVRVAWARRFRTRGV